MSAWPTATLGEIAQPKQWPTLSMAEMKATGFAVYGANGRIGYTDQFTHERPTILIGCRGSCGTVHITEPQSYANGNAMALDSLDETRVDIHFLARLLGHRGFRDVTTGTSQPQIIRQNLVRVRVRLPPLPEQRRIAEILDKADELRAKRRAALSQLDTLTQSIFLDMFGDPLSNPRKWRQETLQTFFHFRTGKLDSNAAVPSGPYPFFTCSKEDSRIDIFAFDCEALLLAGNNATADYSVKHYKGKFNAYQRTYVITLRNERNSYDYSRFVLEQRLAELKRISKGTGTKYLTLELLNRIRVPVPPPELQRHFARRVRALEASRTAQRVALGQLNALFTSLQHRAFRGEL